MCGVDCGEVVEVFCEGDSDVCGDDGDSVGGSGLDVVVEGLFCGGGGVVSSIDYV